MMKKYLLGAMMLVGAMTYAQGNQVIVPVDGNGNATANIGIEVSGEVFDHTDKTLVVEIKSSATPDGRGFAFQMPDLFKGKQSEAIVGKFTAKILSADSAPGANDGGKVEAIPAGKMITAKLVDPSNAEADTVTTDSAAGTATNTKIVYNLTGGNTAAGALEHNGSLAVIATAGDTTGTYSDNTVGLRVALKDAE